MPRLAVVAAVLLWSSAEALTLSDDFEDGVLDGALWYTTGTGAVTEFGGRLHLTQRHYLITQQETESGIPHTVRFQATFETADQISITMRTDGVRQSGSFNRPANGMYVTIWHNAVVAVDRFVNGSHINIGRYDSSAGDIPGAGDTFVVEVRDDGTEIVVLIDDAEYLRVTDSTAFPVNRISFSNSEWAGAETTVEWLTINADGAISVEPRSWGRVKAGYVLEASGVQPN